MYVEKFTVFYEYKLNMAAINGSACVDIVLLSYAEKSL
jgi:hypothetical protein